MVITTGPCSANFKENSVPKQVVFMPQLRNSTSNDTGSPQSDSGVELIIESSLLSVLSVLILSGNILVCMAFRRHRKLRTTTNSFLISLAIADIMVGAFSVPYWIYFRLVSADPTSVVYRIYITYDTLCGTASIANLVMISLERCLSVTLPAIHRNISQLTIFLCVGSTWVYALIVALLDYIDGSEEWYPLFVSNASFFAPLLIILIAYSIIFRIARYRARRVGSIAREVRVAVTLAVVIMAFVVAWLPFFVTLLVFVYCRHCTVPFKVMMPLVKWMHYSGSMVNPVIYTYRNKDFRAAFLKILCPWRRKHYSKSLMEHSRNSNTQGLIPLKNLTNGNGNQHIENRVQYVNAL